MPNPPAYFGQPRQATPDPYQGLYNYQPEVRPRAFGPNSNGEIAPNLQDDYRNPLAGRQLAEMPTFPQYTPPPNQTIPGFVSGYGSMPTNSVIPRATLYGGLVDQRFSQGIEYPPPPTATPQSVGAPIPTASFGQRQPVSIGIEQTTRPSPIDYDLGTGSTQSGRQAQADAILAEMPKFDEQITQLLTVNDRRKESASGKNSSRLKLVDSEIAKLEKALATKGKIHPDNMRRLERLKAESTKLAAPATNKSYLNKTEQAKLDARQAELSNLNTDLSWLLPTLPTNTTSSTTRQVR